MCIIPKPICLLPASNNVLILASVILVNMFIILPIRPVLSNLPSALVKICIRNRHGSLEKRHRQFGLRGNYKMFSKRLREAGGWDGGSHGFKAISDQVIGLFTT